MLFLLLSVLSIASALDDSGSSVGDILIYVTLTLAVIFGIISFFSWRKTYKAKKNLLNLIFWLFPFAVLVIYAVCFFITYHKIHKAYFLHATSNGNHRYDFYFRNDSTLKIVGHFLLNDVQTFQHFQMKGDTILIDKIPDSTEFTQKKYFVNISHDSIYRMLTPVNERGQKIDSISLYIESK